MFTQFAHGNFAVDVEGEFHCGPDNTSPKIFGWSVNINWPDEALDEHGFLLDNTSFRHYFDTLAVTSDSCELIVLKAAKHFKAIAKDAQAVTVSIEVPGLATVSNTQP